jgi:hypothetical protein
LFNRIVMFFLRFVGRDRAICRGLVGFSLFRFIFRFFFRRLLSRELYILRFVLNWIVWTDSAVFWLYSFFLLRSDLNSFPSFGSIWLLIRNFLFAFFYFGVAVLSCFFYYCIYNWLICFLSRLVKNFFHGQLVL